MDQTGFYLLFIPGLMLATLAVSFAFAAFAFTQGPFQRETKRGLISLTVVIALAAALFALAFNVDHPGLPGGS
jgi:hypothetical protein